MLPKHGAPSAPPTYFTLRQAVEHGYGAYSTLRSWIASGRLPAVKIGGRIKVRPEHLEALAQPASSRTDDERLDEAVARAVAALPPLTVSQRQQLGRIIGGSR